MPTTENINTIIERMTVAFVLFRALLRLIAKIALTLMLLLVVVSSLGRYLFSSPVPNMVNIVELLLLPTVVWAYALEVQYNENNITVNLLSNRVSDDTNRVIKILFYPFLVGLLIIAFDDLLSGSIKLWQDQVWSTGTIQIPAYLSRGLITAGVLLLMLITVSQIVRWVTQIGAVQKIRELIARERPQRE